MKTLEQSNLLNKSKFKTTLALFLINMRHLKSMESYSSYAFSRRRNVELL